MGVAVLDCTSSKKVVYLNSPAPRNREIAMLMVLATRIGDCNMMANIRGGVSMVADISTVVSFTCFIGLRLLTLNSPDCLG